MRVLVTGAAGYIGSVVTERLIEHGHVVIALDNLEHGNVESVHPDAHFIRGDLLDGALLTECFHGHSIEAVVHLAAEALIPESLTDPGRFFKANVCGGLKLLEAMVAGGVTRLVFSSTAAVYGEPENVPIAEDAPCAPVNSYGESKLSFERILAWYRRAHGLNFVTFRYFNACGATRDRGERHIPETHLIPIVLQAAMGMRDAIPLYGSDYDTPDGTCIRDYVHVADIAAAHLLALAHLDRLGSRVYNLGNETGYSNAEVIETVRRVTGRDVPVCVSPRRPGDPVRLMANSRRVRSELGWDPDYPELETMVETAWAWSRRYPDGYCR